MNQQEQESELEYDTPTEQQLESLSPLEDTLIRNLYGIPYKPRTLEFVGKVFDLTRERVRQIEDMAIHKIRNRPKLKELRKRLSDYQGEEEDQKKWHHGRLKAIAVTHY